MAKIPVEPMMKLAKDKGPKAVKFVKENWKEISQVVGAGAAAAGAINQKVKARKEEKIRKGKMPYRKMQYLHYRSEVLPKLNQLTRKELLDCKFEIEQFIHQIEAEESKQLAIKKPIYSKQIKDWKQILIQIEDKMSAKDYHELILIYNNPNYKSKYYEGFEKFIGNIQNMIKQGNMEEFYTYLQAIANKDRSTIERDFPR